MKKANVLLGRIIILLTVLTTQIYAQVANTQISICNPINVSYRFQLAGPVRREAADPNIVFYKDKYYMFASKSGGYWSSDNLSEWKFIKAPILPHEIYAPTALVMDDAIYFLALKKRSELQVVYKSKDPDSGIWQSIDVTFPFKSSGDPFLFLDDDGRLYFYHGTSDTEPIRGIELNRTTFSPIGEQVDCIKLSLDDYGWERPGDYNTHNGGFLEGAWITKHNGKYYFQYSASGTQYKSYCDGLYMGDSPLGPFTIAESNPFSYKPEGFITGAGHGSTFLDKWGNYWYATTMSISVRQRNERRMGLFPAFFDNDGLFYAYTGFGDFPHTIPNKKMGGPDDYQPTWMLLSYNKPVEVSSSIQEYPKENAVDEEIRTWWSAATGNKGEWLTIDLQNQCSVNAVQINFADEAADIHGRADSIYYQYLLEYSDDKKIWKKMVDKTKNMVDAPHDYIELNTPIKARYIRITNYYVPDGKFSLFGFRIFGKGPGKPASAVDFFNVKRNAQDARNVKLTWSESPGATGYNIRYGIHPDKLYHNYQVFGVNSLDINSLDKHQKYYFKIDTFNENGITKGEKIIEVK